MKQFAESGIDPKQVTRLSKLNDDSENLENQDSKGTVKAVKSAMKNLQLKAVKIGDSDAELEQKMLAEKKEQLKKSVKMLRVIIAGVERGDPAMKKQQMFGGDSEKEQAFHENLARVKERFLRTMFNITKKKESLLFSSKMNKLVTLVRKATKESVIDELVQDIDD